MLFVGKTVRSLDRLCAFQSVGRLMSHRLVSMYTVTDSMYLCTEKPRKIEIDKKTLRFTQQRENTKPIVFMISWFYGKPAQINKYCELYTKNGMDVLVGNISLTHFLFSIKSAEKFGLDIAKALKNNEDHYKEIFLHIFSAGGGMWGISQRMMKRHPEYTDVPNRILGQVWDSVADPSKTNLAIPFALFPNNQFLQSLVRAAFWVHLKVYKKLWIHFDDAMDRFKNPMSRSPALVFASKADMIGTAEFGKSFTDHWKQIGMDVKYKCFEDSPHIKHFQRYPKEYTMLLEEHWEKVKLLDRK